MKLNIIAAFNNNRVIGDSKYNGLLWNLAQDLCNFKKITLDSYLIMGRKTWESLNCTYLPKRFNAVISNNCRDLNALWGFSNLAFFESIDSAIKFIEKNEITGFRDEIFFTGGLSIYKKALNYNINRIYLSRINNDLAGDLIFPEFEKDFTLKSKTCFKGFEQYIYEK